MNVMPNALLKTVLRKYH